MKSMSLLLLVLLLGAASLAIAAPVQFVPATTDAYYRNPRFSPDGKYLLFLRQQKEHGDATICVAPIAKTLNITEADMEAMKSHRLSMDYFSAPGIDWLPDSRQFAAIVERTGTPPPRQRICGFSIPTACW